MWSFFVVEIEKPLQGREPPSLLFVRLEESLDLAVGLWPTNRAQRLLDPVFVEIGFECVCRLAVRVPARCVKFGSMIGDNLQDFAGCGILVSDGIKQLDAPIGGATIGLDHVQNQPRSVILDRQAPLLPRVVEPIHVHGNERILAFPADPRPLSALFVRVLRHVIVLLEDGMDAVIVNRKVVSNAKDVGDCCCTEFEAIVQLQNPVDEVVGIRPIRLPTWRIQRRDLAGFSVRLGQLLDASSADVELLGNELGVEVIINNSFTDPVNIILVQLHLIDTNKWVIVLTKSFPDSTVGFFMILIKKLIEKAVANELLNISNELIILRYSIHSSSRFPIDLAHQPTFHEPFNNIVHYRPIEIGNFSICATVSVRSGNATSALSNCTLVDFENTWTMVSFD